MVLLRASGSTLPLMVEYLKAENEILRSKLPDRITVTPQERNRLVKLGAALGDAITGLVTIVTPRTFLRWLAAERPKAAKQPSAPPKRKPGRPKTPQEIADVVVKLAKETGWAYTRILGELRRLGSGVCPGRRWSTS